MENNMYDFSIWKEILPDMDVIDNFLEELLPEGNSINAMDWFSDVLKGKLILDPAVLFDFVTQTIQQFMSDWKILFVSVLAIFILSSIVTGFMTAFKNEGAAKLARMFFVLCQMMVMLSYFREISAIVTQTMTKLLEFLKLMVPSYMICVAATGSGLTAVVFYKILLGFVCAVEAVVIATLTPIIEGYLILGIVEGIWNEGRLKGLLDLIKKGIQMLLKAMIVLLTGSSALQTIITPVVDKVNMSIVQKTAGAIPAVGDMAESISGITIASALAVKNSLGVMILVVLVLIMMAPIIRIIIILGTLKVSCALGAVCGEKQMINSVDYISEAGFLMLRMMITVTALFFIAIAAITNSTGGVV